MSYKYSAGVEAEADADVEAEVDAEVEKRELKRTLKRKQKRTLKHVYTFYNFRCAGWRVLYGFNKDDFYNGHNGPQWANGFTLIPSAESMITIRETITFPVTGLNRSEGIFLYQNTF